MPIPEATEVDQETYESMPPPPPPRGTREYRKLLLTINAADDARDFDDACRPVILHAGWRGAVDLMIELLYLVGTHAPDRCVDAYGKLRLKGEYAFMDEDEYMRHATKMAPRLYPELPPHEALRRTLAAGDLVWQLPDELLPVWEEAATALRRDGYTGGHTAARVALTRWLNDNHRDMRVIMAMAAANVSHTMWRQVLPPGMEWVEGVLGDAPDLTGSLAWSRSADPQEVERMAPGMMDEILAQGVADDRRRRRRKDARKRCSCCGRKRCS